MLREVFFLLLEVVGVLLLSMELADLEVLQFFQVLVVLEELRLL